MGIISTIKSMLGLEESERSRPDTSVTVEHEPDMSSDRPGTESDNGGMTTGPETENTVGETIDTESEEDEATSVATAESDGERVAEIKGIGPAYAGRLEQAGVETVADLADADADELARETDIAATRIQNWIDRARSRRD